MKQLKAIEVLRRELQNNYEKRPFIIKRELYNKEKIEDFHEAIEELEFYLSKRNSYPPCDTCGKEVDYMPWHYSTEKERHLHSCDECWESKKDKFTLKG